MKIALVRTAVALLLALGAAASWWAWLAWDHTYQRDPATGQWHGPYQAWQVVGCGVTLIALALYGAIRWHPLTVVLMPAAFTAAWVQTVLATRDPVSDDGMWLAGAFLVLVGTSGGAAILAAMGATARSGRRVPPF
jgi:hypothetical protein